MLAYKILKGWTMKHKGLVLLMCAVHMVCPTAYSDVVYVDHGADGASDGSTWLDAFDSLQGALDVASFGDQIWMTTGVHRPTRQAERTDPTSTTEDIRDATFWIPRGVQLYGGFRGGEDTIDQRPESLSHTVLSGDIGVPNDDSDDSYRVVYYRSVHGGGYGASDTDQSVPAHLDGILVTSANADSAVGGGVYATSVAIGSAVYNSRINFSNCVFIGNSSVGNGGGAYISRWAGAMEDCEFRDNYSQSNGGGLYLNQIAGSRSIVSSIFSGNIAEDDGGGLCRRGDGVSSPGVHPLIVLNCKFLSNSAGQNGGGISYRSNVSGSIKFPLAVANSEFIQNAAKSNGGGLYLWEGAALPGPGTIPGSEGEIQSSTFGFNVANGMGGGVYAGIGPTSSSSADLLVGNSILWGNIAHEESQANRLVNIYTSCIQGGGWSLPTYFGNITADPLFRDPDAGDYTLLNGSPALDSGWNGLLPPDVVDLDRDFDVTEFLPVDMRFRSRVLDAGVPDTGAGDGAVIDMGAYELCSADFNRDGKLNFFDISALISAFVNEDADADLNGDGTINFFDISAFQTSFLNGC